MSAATNFCCDALHPIVYLNMIATISKDILTVTKGAIVHSVNCIGAAGGLAGAIANKFPSNVELYKNHVEINQRSVTLMGSVFVVEIDPELVICNLFGQFSIGTSIRQTEYAALIRGFEWICKNIQRDIYIPYKIGCGLGGAEWRNVEKIIRNCFAETTQNVYICKI